MDIIRDRLRCRRCLATFNRFNFYSACAHVENRTGLNQAAAAEHHEEVLNVGGDEEIPLEGENEGDEVSVSDSDSEEAAAEEVLNVNIGGEEEHTSDDEEVTDQTVNDRPETPVEGPSEILTKDEDFSSVGGSKGVLDNADALPLQMEDTDSNLRSKATYNWEYKNKK